jgi:hypothetical protein
MASQRAPNGYNNPAYCNQYDYEQLTRHTASGTMNHGNLTYVATAAVDNYCYEEEEEIQLSAVAPRRQMGQLVREPPVGASTVLRITEKRVDNMSPKRNHQHGAAMISPGNRHRNETTITSPRTPKKNDSVIVTSTPRKPHTLASSSPRRAEIPLSPRRQQVRATNTTPLSQVPSARKTILATSPAKSSVRNMKYELTHQASTRPRRNTAIIPPMSSILAPKEQGLSLCRKPPARAGTSPAPGLKASWIHIPAANQVPATRTVTTAGATLLVCGAVTMALCLYMISQVSNRLTARPGPASVSTT